MLLPRLHQKHLQKTPPSPPLTLLPTSPQACSTRADAVHVVRCLRPWIVLVVARLRLCAPPAWNSAEQRSISAPMKVCCTSLVVTRTACPSTSPRTGRSSHAFAWLARSHWPGCCSMTMRTPRRAHEPALPFDLHDTINGGWSGLGAGRGAVPEKGGCGPGGSGPVGGGTGGGGPGEGQHFALFFFPCLTLFLLTFFDVFRVFPDEPRPGPKPHAKLPEPSAVPQHSFN